MSNPWLSIPLDDYEGHMSLPAVGQARMIAEQLDFALESDGRPEVSQSWDVREGTASTKSREACLSALSPWI
jgi:hypothetical protein